MRDNFSRKTVKSKKSSRVLWTFVRLSATFLLIFICASFSGCTGSYNIRDLGIVRAVGIDCDGSGYTVSLLIYETEETHTLITAFASQPQAAFFLLEQKYGARLYYKGCTVLTVGGGCSEASLAGMFDTLGDLNGANLSVNVFACEDTAQQFLRQVNDGGALEALLRLVESGESYRFPRAFQLLSDKPLQLGSKYLPLVVQGEGGPTVGGGVLFARQGAQEVLPQRLNNSCGILSGFLKSCEFTDRCSLKNISVSFDNLAQAVCVSASVVCPSGYDYEAQTDEICAMLTQDCSQLYELYGADICGVYAVAKAFGWSGELPMIVCNFARVYSD